MRLLELYLVKKTLGNTSSSVRPALRVEEGTADSENSTSLALDEPRSAMVVTYGLTSYLYFIAGPELTWFRREYYPHLSPKSFTLSSISSVVRIPFSTTSVSSDADQRS